MMLDTSRLGAWASLPFFSQTLPKIEAALAAETRAIFPPADKVFAALERCQPQDTRVILLGQDPYHTRGKADGLAFSISDGFPGKLDSLGNIFKELEDDVNVRRHSTSLGPWADQGVLLLNTALTVVEGVAHAHKRLGWQSLVEQVLDLLDSEPRAVVLWGRPAQAVGAKLRNPAHLRIETPHPSPLSAHRGFFGSRPFSTINSWLSTRDEAPINWS